MSANDNNETLFSSGSSYDSLILNELFDRYSPDLVVVKHNSVEEMLKALQDDFRRQKFIGYFFSKIENAHENQLH